MIHVSKFLQPEKDLFRAFLPEMTADTCISTASKKAATSHLVRVLPGVAFALAADAVAAVVAKRRRRVVWATSGLLSKDKQNVFCSFSAY